nr:hypothetical protein Iba_chr05eCG12520 [Ipomoea batatas]GMD90489.1 hypothetical protein Iba_chr14dCG10160 [Ipomoea batatas]
MVTITLRRCAVCSSSMLDLDLGFCGIPSSHSLTPRPLLRLMFLATSTRANC